MRYTAKIIGENPEVEEELIIKINGQTLTCFVNEYNYKIEIGKTYPIDLEVTILDELEMKQISTEKQSIEQIDDSFSYNIKGKFNPSRGVIDAGIQIPLESEDISDFWYLENKYVQIKVDRINIEFV